MDDNNLLTKIRSLIIEHNGIRDQINQTLKKHIEEIKKIRDGTRLIDDYDQMCLK